MSGESMTERTVANHLSDESAEQRENTSLKMIERRLVQDVLQGLLVQAKRFEGMLDVLHFAVPHEACEIRREWVKACHDEVEKSIQKWRTWTNREVEHLTGSQFGLGRVEGEV
ncbi:hypothetical protein BJ742DRAFT_736174 [Cladochytrium replicatum]|nr:hypothetical protein BJ742DRAFT_736174 [Cladochytrium replicatum]